MPQLRIRTKDEVWVFHGGSDRKFFYTVGSEVTGDLTRFGPKLETYVEHFKRLYDDLSPDPESGRVAPSGFLRALAIRVFNQRAALSVEPVPNTPLGPITKRNPLLYEGRPPLDNQLEDIRKAFVELPIVRLFGLTYEDAVTMPINEWRDIVDLARKVNEMELAQMRDAQNKIKAAQAQNKTESRTA